MDAVQRLTQRLFTLPVPGRCFRETFSKSPTGIHPLVGRKPIVRCRKILPEPALCTKLTPSLIGRHYRSSSTVAGAGWFLGLADKKQVLPEIVQAGDPVLHEPAQEVRPEEIGSERIQKIIGDMVQVMRKAPGVGLAAPQIGIPLKVSLFCFICKLTEFSSYISFFFVFYILRKLKRLLC